MVVVRTEIGLDSSPQKKPSPVNFVGVLFPESKPNAPHVFEQKQAIPSGFIPLKVGGFIS